MSTSRFKLAIIQLAVSDDKADNLSRTCKKIAEAAEAGANVVALTECFNSLYGNAYFPEYAEPIPGGESTEALSRAAKDNRVVLVGGSIPERVGDQLFNTCTVYNPEGNLIAIYRKSHLVEIDIPGEYTFKESKTLTRGDELVAINTPYYRIGIGICFDIRFSQMARSYVDGGCKLLIYPAAFNMTTGPAHLEVLTRARALDNLVYVACCSPARDESASYVAWGHSLVVNPWAEVVAKADEKEQIIYADIDLDRVGEVRDQLPVLKVGRPDLYARPVHNVPCCEDSPTK